jgi:hypothetical protein
MRFYLGTHKAAWLERVEIPLFVSVRTLRGRKKMPRALGPWALDSGGFTELNMNGAWQTTPKQYVADVRRIQQEVGQLAWAASCDWMCETFVLKKTGKSVAEHQRLTVENYIELRQLAPELPFAPVLQGFHLDDYLRCFDLYQKKGVNLYDAPVVGVGTMCRRQGTQDAHKILGELAKTGLPLHAFGFKKAGLLLSRRFLASSDSLAWSYDARRNQMVRCGGKHKSCANCMTFALLWRKRLLQELEAADKQLDLFSSPSPRGPTKVAV